MPRNFRLRTFLILIAVVGAGMGLLLNLASERRRSVYRQKVESFALGEADVIEQIADRLREAREAEAQGPEGRERATRLRDEAEQLARVAAWHVKMERQYARAADHPWSPIPVTLPPP